MRFSPIKIWKNERVIWLVLTIGFNPRKEKKRYVTDNPNRRKRSESGGESRSAAATTTAPAAPPTPARTTKSDDENDINHHRTTMASPFANKTIIITGAGGNFGREGCMYFAARGAKIAAFDKNATTLEETKAEVKAKHPDAVVATIECDVTSLESVKTAVTSALSELNSTTIDCLWNNAGYQGQIKPTLEYDVQDFALVMNINVTGMFTVLQQVAKVMKESGSGGTIVNTASVAGLRGTPAMVAYSSSKAAVLAMTVATSKDLAPYGIRVNAVSPALIGPGFMWTRQNELHAQSGSPYFHTDPDVVAKNKVNGVPMKRLGSVEEVVKSVAFLLSDEASYTTGTNLVVDGGMSGGLKA